MAKRMITATAHKAKAGGKRHPYHSIHIEPADNGHIVTTHRRNPEPQKEGDMASMLMAQRPHVGVFTSPDEASAHVQSMMQDGVPPQADPSAPSGS